MNEKKIEEAAKALLGLSYFDWQKLKVGVDSAFDKKEREFKRELELSSSDEILGIIRAQFG